MSELAAINRKLDLILRLLHHQRSFYKTIEGVRYIRSILNLADRFEHSGGRVSEAECVQLLDVVAADGKVTDAERRTLNYIKKGYNLTSKADLLLEGFLLNTDTIESDEQGPSAVQSM